MGFLSRKLLPRSVRRAAHPVRTVKSAATPKIVKRARRAMSPIDSAIYGVERNLSTPPRRRASGPIYRHGDCAVRHRSPQAAARCRNP